MLFHKNNYDKCPECKESYDIFKGCQNCKDLELLKDVTCPCCKGTDIFIDRQYASNNIIGSGCSTWVVSQHFVCYTCGVMFLDPKKFKK